MANLSILSKQDLSKQVLSKQDPNPSKQDLKYVIEIIKSKTKKDENTLDKTKKDENTLDKTKKEETTMTDDEIYDKILASLNSESEILSLHEPLPEITKEELLSKINICDKKKLSLINFEIEYIISKNNDIQLKNTSIIGNSIENLVDFDFDSVECKC